MTQLDVDRICVVIGRTRHKMVQAEVQEAARQGARFLEIRLDLLRKAPDFKRLLADKPGALLATVRRPEDGGRWAGSEEARCMLLRQAIVAGFDWVDLETDVADGIPRFKGVRRIVSYHNLREVPADLEKIYQKMCGQDADVVKIAVRAQHPNDNLRVLALLDKAPRPTVAFCMGDMGMPSRILAGRCGAPFTYAAFNRERTLAPGLLSYAEVRHVYHFPEVNAQTQVFGVIGDPIAHSLSPLVHNLTLRKLGINAVYLPFRVPPADLPGFLQGFDRLPVRGYSVTIPHKEAAAELARHRDEAVTCTGAANTLLRGADGFIAHNTDYQAVVESLRAHLAGQYAPPTSLGQPTGVQTAPTSPALGHLPPQATGEAASLQSKVVLVLGAGGVARAVAHALQREGCLITIANRTLERAIKLAEEVGCRHVEWQSRHGVLCDIVINCTSVGMHPHVDETPLHHSYLKPGLIVFDTVYTPENTLLIKEARDRGCRILTGVDLFVRQAALQFKLFTGREAPVEYMRKIVKRALSPVAMQPEQEEK